MLIIWRFLTGGSLLGKITSYVLIAGFLLASFWGAKLVYDNSIRKDERQKLILSQLKLVQEENEKFRNQLKAISDFQSKLLKEIEEKNKELEKRIREADEFLDTEDANKSDRDSSSVLKETLKKLGAPK